MNKYLNEPEYSSPDEEAAMESLKRLTKISSRAAQSFARKLTGER